MYTITAHPTFLIDEYAMAVAYSMITASNDHRLRVFVCVCDGYDGRRVFNDQHRTRRRRGAGYNIISHIAAQL